MSALDIQVGGRHYQRYAIQPITFIMANGWDFCAGNVLKYVLRFDEKGGVQDLEKALHYVALRQELLARYNRIWNWVRSFWNSHEWLTPQGGIKVADFVKQNSLRGDIHFPVVMLDQWVRTGEDAPLTALVSHIQDMINEAVDRQTSRG